MPVEVEAQETCVRCESEAETEAFAGRFAELLRAGDRVILEGPLGAGKTFFVRALLYARGLGRDKDVTSPTFSLVQRYEELAPAIWHADLYRLGNVAEIGEIELIGAEHILLAEWGERFLPEIAPTWLLRITICSDEGREISVTGAKERLQSLR